MSEKVIVELLAKVEGFDARIRQSANAFDGGMRRIEASANATERAIRGTVGRLALAFGTIFTAQQIAQIVDGAKQIEAQLQLATKEFGSFAQAQKDVRDIATSTRSNLEATASLYASFARSANELGVNQEQVGRITRTVTEAFKVSGASAAEASGSIRQLSQAFASGVLRGDEFNSIMEGAPRLAKLLADSLGVPIGQLRAMAEEGELTADKLVKAFSDKRFTDGLDAEFRQMPVTFSDAMEQVNTAATITFGAFDRGGGFSQMLANFVTDGANGFADLEKASEDLGVEVRSNMEALADVFQPMLDGARSIFDEIAGEASTLTDFIARELRDIDRFTGSLSQQGLGGALLTGNSVEDWWNERAAGTNLEQPFRQRQARAERLRRGELGEMAIGRLNQGRDALGNKLFPDSPRSTYTGGGGGRRGGGRSNAESEARKAEQERLKAIREQASYERETAYLAEDIQAAKAAMLVASEDILAYELTKIQGEKERAQKDIATDVKLGKLTDQQATELTGLVDELAGVKEEVAKRKAAERAFRLNEQRIGAEADIAGAQRDVQGEILRGQLDMARTQKERRSLETRLLDLQFQEERIRNNLLIAYAERLRTQEGVAESERIEAEAAAEIARIRNESIEARQGQAQQSVDRNTQSPLQSYFSEIPSSMDEINEALENVAAGGLATFTDALTDAIVNFTSLKDVGLATLQAITAGLVRMAIQQVLLRTIGDSLGQAATAATTAQASAAAAAWAPAAALASLATLGANAGPAAAALATTTALSQALAATSVARKDGGPIFGAGGPRDDKVLMRASPGEYVIKASSAAKLGMGALNFINERGELPMLRAAGGSVGRIRPNNSPLSVRGGGMDDNAIRRIEAAVERGAAAQAPVQLFPTYDPVEAFERALSTPRGQKAMLDFAGSNSGKFNSQLNR